MIIYNDHLLLLEWSLKMIIIIDYIICTFFTLHLIWSLLCYICIIHVQCDVNTKQDRVWNTQHFNAKLIRSSVMCPTWFPETATSKCENVMASGPSLTELQVIYWAKRQSMVDGTSVYHAICVYSFVQRHFWGTIPKSCMQQRFPCSLPFMHRCGFHSKKPL